MLALVNSYRAAAGVPPVTLDATLTKGCHEHAEYLRLNWGKAELYSTRAHTQVPTLPGATPDGAACGKAADLYQGVLSLELAVDGWMESLYHRKPVISPDVVKVGIGYTMLGSRYIIALQFVYADQWRGAPLIYPANGQTDVPLDFTREEPNPIPPPTIFAGHPITLQFSQTASYTNARATLVDAAGKAVPFWLSSPEHPASPYNAQARLIGLIPQQPLRSATRYTASITVERDGVPKTWTTTFTTKARKRIEATDEDALYAALGKPILLVGTARGASKVTEGSAAITLDIPRGKRIHTLKIDVLRDVLKVPLDQVAGMHVEVEGRVTVESGYAQLSLAPGSALRLTR